MYWLEFMHNGCFSHTWNLKPSSHAGSTSTIDHPMSCSIQLRREALKHTVAKRIISLPVVLSGHILLKQ
jgi:hypothetical protein